MTVDSAALDKLLKSRKTRGFVADLAQLLGLGGGVIQVASNGGQDALEIAVAAASPDERKANARAREGLRISLNGKHSPNANVSALLYALERYVESEQASAEVSRHALEKYRELALLYKFGEGLNHVTKRQDLVDLGYRLMSSRVQFDCLCVALLAVPPDGWEVMQPTDRVAPELHKNSVRFDVLSGLLTGGNSRILNNPTEGERLWDRTVMPASSLIIVPLLDGAHPLGALVFSRHATDTPFSSEDQHLLTSFGFLFSGKLADINLLEKMLKDERMVAIGSMASSIIHDVKNPLTSIMAFAELLGDLEFSQEERKEYSNMIVEEVQRLTGMVEDLLEFTRGGQSRYEIAPTPIPELIAEVSRLVKRDMAERGIEYETTIEGSEMILADKDKLKRVLLNLASNARDAMQQGGSLRITTAANGGKTHICVADTGPGIPEQIRDRLFEPFVTHGKKGGTGLGTAISKKIVEDMSGRIWFETARGRGTTFHIELPSA